MPQNACLYLGLLLFCAPLAVRGEGQTSATELAAKVSPKPLRINFNRIASAPPSPFLKVENASYLSLASAGTESTIAVYDHPLSDSTSPGSAALPEAPQVQTDGQAIGASLPPSEDGARISGVVVDPSGAAVPGAEVTLSRTAVPGERRFTSDAEGEFVFAMLPAGSYVLTIRARGFRSYSSRPLEIAAQEQRDVPQIALEIASTDIEVTVRPTEQIAAEQVRAEERQRVFGIIPAFYTSYVRDAAPLTAKQKFSLAAHDTFDPVTLFGVAARAGVEQANKTYPGYGNDAAGYGKRFGAALGDSLISDFLGHAVFPSLLHQDPRYFYQGSGTRKERFYHAISFAILTRSDSGHLTPNLSYLLGDLAAGGLSNLYYPHADRGAGLVFTNAAVGIGGRAAGAVFREFVSKRVTTNVPNSGKP